MSMFVAWLVSTIVAVGVTIARELTEVEVLNWLFIPLWIVCLILFCSMLFSVICRVEELSRHACTDIRIAFVATLIATIVTLVLVFVTVVAKIEIPIWAPIISGSITFVILCIFLFTLNSTLDYLEEMEREREERERKRIEKGLY